MRAPGSFPNFHATAGLQRHLRVTGIVQGVGFRPYVWHLARELNLGGWVRNDAAGVDILVEGDAADIDNFTRRLPLEIPILASVGSMAWNDAQSGEGYEDFRIAESGAGQLATMIGHDTAVCHDCLTEMFTPGNRRWRYAFINCTHCGPRFTLTRKLPYDRAQTSMEAFPMCVSCDREYRNPQDRRFHAEPIACPACGPQMKLVDMNGQAYPVRDPVEAAWQLLSEGKVVAIKGLGGFHLACDARNASAVQGLRQRKRRDEKPLAVMVANVESILPWVEISEEEKTLLNSAERPVVLLRKKAGADNILSGIAPGLDRIGVMLPYTPIHWLVFHQSAGRPEYPEWITGVQALMLVMTSANPCGEPLVIENKEAVKRLANLADAVLLHDREIVVRCDDSVMRMTAERMPQYIRRARGYAPRPIRLLRTGPSVLALGAYAKNTLCITRGNEAFVSQYIGSLNNPETCNMLMEVTEYFVGMLNVRPELIAHDLHPDFFSTAYAQKLSEQWHVPTIGVQHHHAHIAAVLAEHNIADPVLGLALDGMGMGSDGTVWGGELLVVTGHTFRRHGSLSLLPLPGGDKAAQEPWRMAAAVLFLLGRGGEIASRFPQQPSAGRLCQVLERKNLNPMTSSMGRWFDAAAGLLGLCETSSYEGQASMRLEMLAEQAGHVPPLEGGYLLNDNGQLDLLPLLARLADEKNIAWGAALFHSTLAHALAEWVQHARRLTDLDTVVLAGGCFLNQVLSKQLTQLLSLRNVHVLTARQIPPNDGGLSLGQAWVAIQAIT
ncbi:MAG: carbamoyltransferase HypF [Burkholderiales bacterium]